MNLNDATDFLGCSKRTVQRYIKSGKLPYKTKNGVIDVKKRDLAPLLLKLINNRDKHRPDASDSTPSMTKAQMIKKATSSPSVSLLDNIGEKVLMETTKLIEENGLLLGIERTTVMRYALAVQLKDKYLNTFLESNESFYMNVVKQFQSEIQHYEKELGLTPASLAKIKPQEKEEKDVDPMELLLNA